MRKMTIYIWAVIIVALALILTSCDPCFWAAGHPSRQCIEWQAKEAKK